MTITLLELFPVGSPVADVEHHRKNGGETYFFLEGGLWEGDENHQFFPLV